MTIEMNEKNLKTILKRFIEELNKITNVEIQILPNEPKIVAICEYDFSYDPNLALLNENQKIIFLDTGFNDLSINDKSLFVSATIKTHFQLCEGLIGGYGKILYYELINDSHSSNKLIFNTNGVPSIEFGFQIEI